MFKHEKMLFHPVGIERPNQAHNQMFRDAFNKVQNSGSNRDFGTTKAAKMYFSMSDPGPNAFATNHTTPVSFDK